MKGVVDNLHNQAIYISEDIQSQMAPRNREITIYKESAKGKRDSVCCRESWSWCLPSSDLEPESLQVTNARN